jgi:capsular exopolysaccharide synthesis family protein
LPTLAPPPAELAETSGAVESRLSPLALWAAIRKNWALVVALTAAIALATTFYTLGQTKIYEARATILFDPQPTSPLGDQVQTVVDMGAAYWNNKEYYKTQYWVIQSMRTASQVVTELGLHKNAAFIANVPASSKPAAREVSVEDAAQRLIGRLTVEPVKDSRLATVKYQDADPERAQKILSALVDTYVQNNLGDLMESATTAADWLRSQHTSLKKELEDSEMLLHGYKRDKNILSVSMDDQSNMLREEMTQLNQALTEVATKREQAAARRAELMKITAEDPAKLPANELLNNALLQGLREQYVDAVRTRNALIGGGKGAEHPEVKAIDARAAATKQALLAEVHNIQGAVSRELAALDKEHGGLQKLFESAKTKALELNLLEIEYNRLRRNKETNEKLYSLVTERSKESDLTRMLRVNNIRVADRPLRPKSPVSPNVPLNMAGGLLVGLVLGFGAAIGKEQLDRTVKTPDDVERELSLNFLGLLPELGDGSKPAYYTRRADRRRRHPPPDEPLGSMELIVHQQPSSGIAEAARAIRTNILFMSPDRPFHTMLVTSAGPSEGKTTVACCIAIAMAQTGKRVVLLDCDMRRPRVHRVFKQPNDVGITTTLIDLPSVGAAVKATDVPNLSILTTGPIPPNPAELLHSEAFEKLLAVLRERFDRVIIDSPPVVPVTDAAILSTKVDGTVLVIRAFKTSKELARRAVRALRDVGGYAVGTVLNAVDLERREYGYYQYYYYKREGYAAPDGNAGDLESGSSEASPPPPAA